MKRTSCPHCGSGPEDWKDNAPTTAGNERKKCTVCDRRFVVEIRRKPTPKELADGKEIERQQAALHAIPSPSKWELENLR